MLRTADESGLGERWVNRQLVKYEDAQLLGLLARPRPTHLSPSDVDAPTVLRVVSVFDELVERCASPDDLVRSVSRWTDCAAGLSGPDGQVLARCDRRGARLPGGEPSVSTYREAFSHGILSARLWIERDVATSPLDEVVLARGARAAHQILERMMEGGAAVSPIPGLVESLIDADLSVSRRSRACRELGYEPSQAITVAVAQVTGGREALPARVGNRIRSSGGGRVRVADFGVSAILVTSGTVDADTLALAGMERPVGIGPARPAIDAPRSYHGARAALRFAQGPGAPPIAQFDQLGSVAALAGVVDTDLIEFPDWVALVELSRTETGVTAILTAEILMRTGSQREAAARMNLHHSTVAHRVGHVEQALGYGLGEHSNWFRAQLAIHLWRLSWPDPVRTTTSGRCLTATAEVPPSA